MPPVGVGAVQTVGGDLVSGLSPHYRDGPVFDPRIDGAPEQSLHRLRQRVRGDVPVLRFPPEKGIPHAAAHGISFISRFRKGIHDQKHVVWYLHINSGNRKGLPPAAPFIFSTRCPSRPSSSRAFRSRRRSRRSFPDGTACSGWWLWSAP